MSDVLIVEDNEDTRIVLAYLLKAEGHTVCAVGSVRLAIEEALLACYDVLISDISLPDGDGWELIKELRRSGNTMRGIAMSGHCSARDIEKSLASGFQHHLHKPVDFDEIKLVMQINIAT